MEEFTKEYVSMWQRWSEFDGKSNVKEFWMAVLINAVVLIILAILRTFIPIFGIIGVIYGVAIIIPAFALGLRRFHDAGKSGWNYLWFLTIIGIIYVIYLWIQPSK